MRKKICGITFPVILMFLVTAGCALAEDFSSGEPDLSLVPKKEAGIVTDVRWYKPDEIPMAEYTLGPDDAVGIEVKRHPEFSGIIIITKTGRVTFPLGADRSFRALPEYKDLRPVGLTEQELTDVIKQRLKRYLYEPNVSVGVIDYGSKKYYVVGEVGRPGRYTLRGSTMELKDAIFEAGLPTPSAALRRARIIKPDEEEPKIKKVNLYALLYKGDLKHNLRIEPGDIVYVPSTVAKKINSLLDQILNPASQANALERLYYQYDTDHYRNLYRYDEWYYANRPGYSR